MHSSSPLSASVQHSRTGGFAWVVSSILFLSWRSSALVDRADGILRKITESFAQDRLKADGDRLRAASRTREGVRAFHDALAIVAEAVSPAKALSRRTATRAGRTRPAPERRGLSARSGRSATDRLRPTGS